ncbi:MAG: amphi-Trp domain-containing protein [Desulfohalobiaceae bacterium]
MAGQKFALQQSMDRGTLTSYLEELIKALKGGKVVLQKEEHFISLTPNEQVSLEISAKQKPDKEEMSLEISWQPKQVQAEAAQSVFKISQTEPEAPNQAAASAEAKAQPGPAASAGAQAEEKKTGNK